MSCLVYHDLPALDDFRHESTRKCAETTRRRKSSRTHPQKAENRPACGYRTVFCSIGIMGMAYFQSASLHLHYTTNGGKSRAVLHESSKNGSKCLLPGGIAAENARQRKKELPHSAVRQSLFCVPKGCARAFLGFLGRFDAFQGSFTQNCSTFAAVRGILRAQSSALQLCHSRNSYRAENRPVTANRAVFCFLRVHPVTPGRFSAFAGRFVPKTVQSGQNVVHWVQQKRPAWRALEKERILCKNGSSAWFWR